MQKIFYYTIFPAVILIPTNILILELNYFNTIISESDIYLTNTTIILLYVMIILCYIQCIRIKNGKGENCYKPKQVFNGSLYNHRIYMNNKICNQDNIFKPSRTSHCHICGCQLRMDHHCPWINNCVGLRNHRAFVLFCTYSMLFGYIYDYKCIKFYLYTKSLQTPIQFSSFFIKYWITMTVITFILTLSLTALVVTHFLLIARNITTLDLMKHQLSFRTDVKRPNMFDLTPLTNIAMFFENDKFLFWWPKVRISNNDGIQYPMIPPVRDEEVQGLPSRIQEELKSDEEKSLPKTLEELVQKNSPLYKDIVFEYMGESYTISSNLKEQQQSQKYQQLPQQPHSISSQPPPLAFSDLIQLHDAHDNNYKNTNQLSD